MSVSWLLPEVHKTGAVLHLYFNVHVQMSVAESEMISPAVLKVFSLATAAMALRAVSERLGASSKEMADRQRHLATSACSRRGRLKISLCCEELRMSSQKMSELTNQILL